MLFDARHAMCQLLIAFFMCTSLAGQTAPKTEISILTTLQPSRASTNSTNTSVGNKTTSSTKGWYFLNEEEAEILKTTTISVAALGALLNFVVIFAMAIDPLKVLRKGPWITILNLAIADLISCVSWFCIAGEFKVIDENELYTAINDFSWGFGISASFLMLSFFTVQIFLITKFPLKRRYWFTTRKIVLAGIAVWLFAFLLGLSSIAHHRFSLMVCFKIWAARIGVLQILVVVQVVLNIQVTIEIIRSGRSVGNAQNNKNRILAKTVIILTLILFLTAFPYFLLRQIEFLARSGYFGQGKTLQITRYLSYCYAPIALLNFAANPIIYSLRLPNYRQTLLAFVGKNKSKSGSPKRTTMSKLTNAFSLRSQRTSDTSPAKSKRCSLERSPMHHNADQPM